MKYDFVFSHCSRKVQEKINKAETRQINPPPPTNYNKTNKQTTKQTNKQTMKQT